MTNKSQEVIDIVADLMELDPSTIDLTKSFADLGADSLTSIEIIVALETKFGIEVPDNFDPNTTIQTVINYLDK